MTPAEKLAEWIARAHVRVCDRAPGTNGPDDQGTRAGCGTACSWRSDPARALPEARKVAAHGHVKYNHPGTPRACQSPHDVLCRAVW